jgi:hypothetical protein
MQTAFGNLGMVGEAQHKKSKEMAEFWGLFLLSSSLFW